MFPGFPEASVHFRKWYKSARVGSEHRCSKKSPMRNSKGPFAVSFECRPVHVSTAEPLTSRILPCWYIRSRESATRSLFSFRLVLHQGTRVLSCTPCQPFIMSPRTALTIRCCFSILAPRNFSELMSIPYMEPHPPDISCTTSSTGLNSVVRRSQIVDSASSRKSGFSMVLGFAVVVASGAAAEE